MIDTQFAKDADASERIENYPQMNLTNAQKRKKYGSIDKWAMHIINAIDHTLLYSYNVRNNTLGDKLKHATNLDLVELGTYDTKAQTDMLKRFSFLINDENIELPFDVEHFDIITPKIQQLVGEEINRAFEPLVMSFGSYEGSLEEQEYSKVLSQYYEQMAYVEIYKFAPELVNPEIINDPEKKQAIINTPDGKPLKTIDDVKFYLQYGLKSAGEKVANELLHYLIKKYDLKLMFEINFLKFLATGLDVYYTGMTDKELICRWVDPRNFDMDLSFNTMDVSESAFYREVRWVTLNEVFRDYHNHLTDEDIDFLEKTKGYRAGMERESFYSHINNVRFITATGVRVARFEWKSLSRKQVINRINLATGEIEEVLEDDDYEINNTKNKKLGIKEEFVKDLWVPETWEGTKIGDGCYIKMQPIENQYHDINNLGKHYSSYSGYRIFYSMVDRIKPYQFLYNIVWYKLKHAFARAKGMGFLMDEHQIPKSSGWDIQKWMYYGGISGFYYVNSSERNTFGEKSNFNQFQTIDLTLGEEINHYINVLEYLKNSIQEVTGITPQREGQTKATETLGGVERSVAQSVANTEYYFNIHNKAKEKTLQNILNIAKSLFKVNETFSYILSDGARILNVINEKFFEEDLGVFVTTNGADIQKLRMIQSMVNQNYSARGETSNAIDVLLANSIGEIKMIDYKFNQELKAAQEQASAMEQQKNQAEAELKKLETDLRKEELQINKYKIDADNETKIRVAEISAYGLVTANREDAAVDANGNGTTDALETEYLQLEKDKFEWDKEKDTRELNIKEKALNIDPNKNQQNPNQKGGGQNQNQQQGQGNQKPNQNMNNQKQ